MKTPRVEVTPERQTAEGLDGERKTVTALFADIKGSMELIEDLDPEEARAIVDPALKLMMDAVHRYEGYVVQSTGDGIFALFGAPVAHEDHPQRALHAALQDAGGPQALRRQAARAGAAADRVRVGVNTGEVVVRSIQTGERIPNTRRSGIRPAWRRGCRRSRRPGSIVIERAYAEIWSKATSQFKALGPTRVKGVSEPVNVYEVTGLGPLRTRLQLSARRGLTQVRRARARAGGR